MQSMINMHSAKLEILCNQTAEHGYHCRTTAVLVSVQLYSYCNLRISEYEIDPLRSCRAFLTESSKFIDKMKITK